MTTQENELFKLLDKLGYRHSNHSQVLSDLLDWTIGCFLVDGDKPSAERLQNKYEEDYPKFKIGFELLLKCYETNITYNVDTNMGQKFSWTDPLGTIYEELSGKHKRSNLGQFFTPPNICDFMSAILINNDSTFGKYISEPCSGSGRMILAANSFRPGNIYSCVDKDPICTKMTCINMLMHGMIGQATCADALYPIDNWYFCYQVNPHLLQYGIPTLLPVEKENSWEIISFRRNFMKPIKEKIDIPTNLNSDSFINSQQLTLF